MQAVRLALALVCMPALAWADDEPAPPPEPAPTPEPAPPTTTPPAEPAPTTDELAKDIDDLYAKQKELERAQRKDAATSEQVKQLMPLSRSATITVFVDVGAFTVGGDGSGIRSDIGHIYFPKYAGVIPGQWVFMGDPLSTGINSLGEPSDTAMSREIPTDTVNSEGKPSVLVNAVGLSIGKYVGHDVSISSLAELLPRPDHNILDIELAEVDWRPVHDLDLVVSAGKIDSVLGVEYRWQTATKRVGVTPSLICRYTCGRPLGIGAQLLTLEQRFRAAATLTNGDNFQQLFEPETALHASSLPTASGHVQWIFHVGQGLELGASGAVGPQDNQPDRSLVQWHYGLDARLIDLEGFDVSVEYVQGKQPGQSDSMTPCDLAPCLTYKGAYVLVDRRMSPKVTPYVRWDWRSAVHTKGAEFVYESHTMRATVGARFDLTSQIIAKIEYTFNRELGGIPQFPDDILTSSLVVTTD